MYIETNDIRSLRDRAPEGCGCEREAGKANEMRQPREMHPSCPFCAGKQGGGIGRDDCSNYFISLGAPLAAVYSPIQVWKDIYNEAQALSRGTLFAELDKPFMAKGRKCK